MPTCDIVKTTAIVESFRVSQVRGMFDYQSKTVEHKWSVQIPIENKEWKIGLIYGPSGSGKTTIAKEAFPDFLIHEKSEWPENMAMLDGFNKSIETKSITEMLNSVGFSSPPSWLKPFQILSNGQKFRAELARALLENKTGVIFDEFTSVVDRDVAKVGCAAVEKTLRRKGFPPFIAVSCHYDIIDWLRPDWIYDVGENRFEWRERRSRPTIEIEIYKTNCSYWEMFRQHHYLDHHINKSAECYVATIKKRPVAFSSVLHFPHPKCKRFKKEHRTVVLPDFQGVGIGNRLSEFVANLYHSKGYRFISTTSAPAMIYHRHRSLKWKTTRFGKAAKGGKSSVLYKNKQSSCNRFTASFEFSP